MQMRSLFDSWSLSSPPLPPRSQLYALEPIGAGTALVESLSSYVARLAEAHSVSVGDLVGRVLSKVPTPQGAIVMRESKACHVGRHGFRVCSYAVNGVTDRVTKWVHALETATSRRDLRYLTLLPFRHVMPGHLFHRQRAWCSSCLEQWRANGQTVYEPLLWAIKVSSHCPAHERPLCHTCPRCGRTLNPLGVFCRPGYCERCGGWLGAPDADSSRPKPGSPGGEDQTWSCRQVAGLLEMLSRVDPVGARESLRRSLIVYLGQVAGGNALALAEYIRCPRSILQHWLDGTAVPRLQNLLRTGRCLNVPASSFFASSGPTPMNIAAAKEAVAIRGNRAVSPYRPASEIRQALLTALDEVVPLSLSGVARRLGYTNTERLYQADRTLCHKIASRYRQSGRSHWWKKPGSTRICETARLKEILKQSLKSPEPTSVHQIAAQLGYSNDGYIQQKFPQLCTAIGKKIARTKQARPARMRQVLENALREHPAPTLVELSQRLGYSTSTVLRTHEPDLCNQLIVQHRTHVAKRRADLERQAMAAIEENPVPSVRNVCQRLGITLWFMNKYFPTVRRMIAEQHRRWVSAETAHRRGLLHREIHNIAAELRCRGVYPSVNRIVERLPKRLHREWEAITLAVREARKALGISK